MKNSKNGYGRLRMAVAYGAVGVIALSALSVGIVNRGAKSPKIDLNATPTPQVGPITAGENTENISENSQTPFRDPVAVENEITGANHDTEVAGVENTDASGKKPLQNNTEGGTDLAKTEGKQSESGLQTAFGGEKDSGKEPAEETPVMNPEMLLSGLLFSEETGMLWPVTGEALVSFSPEHVVYNKTLDCYRTTDYVLLAGEKGSQVCAAAEGIVTSVKQDYRTGTTLTMKVSKEYEIVYGLLSEVAVKEGDHVKQGTVIAKIGEPTRYFVEEGSGLYLQVKKDSQPVNPMMFLSE